jgi:hypothetical protein
MKKILITATFVLASLGAFAAKNDVKSNMRIIPLKNKLEIVKISTFKIKEPVRCSYILRIGDLELIAFYWDC